MTGDRGQIECHVAANKQKAKWIRQDSLVRAIIWMLHKPGHNIPLVKDGDPLPPPGIDNQAPPAYPTLPALQEVAGSDLVDVEAAQWQAPVGTPAAATAAPAAAAAPPAAAAPSAAAAPAATAALAPPTATTPAPAPLAAAPTTVEVDGDVFHDGAYMLYIVCF